MSQDSRVFDIARRRSTLVVTPLPGSEYVEDWQFAAAEQELEAALGEEGIENLEVDLGRSVWFTSPVLHVVLHAAHTVRDRRGLARMTNVSSQMESLLEYLNADEVFDGIAVAAAG